MIRRLFALFAAPSVGAAPDPVLPAPDRGSTAWQVEHAHRVLTVLRADFGRWRSGHPAPSPEEMAEEAEHAAMHLVLFAQGLRDDATEVEVPDFPGQLFGGEG